MAGNIKGIIVEIGGDTSKLQEALKKVNSQSSSLSKELRGVNSLLKLDPKNVELLGQKQTILNENIEVTQSKLNELKKVKDEADKKMAEGTKISEENYRNLQREIINTEKKLGNLTAELKQFNLENSNWTKAGKKIEEYGDKITKASGKINEIGNKASIVSGAVVAGGTVLVNNAMNLEDAVAKYVNTTNTAKEETEKYRQVLENINRNNYGEGYEDIADSMSQVKMQLKDINSQDLQNITEKAIALRDLFGYDVSESIRAVKAMMDNFSISADEAFNLIAEGKKQGLDFSNELLDNVNEYSVQFKKLGLTADDMFNIFKSGAESGAFNLDKIGDAVKEFSIRAIDGSNTTIDGFKRLGLNADAMAKKFAKGGDEAKQAFVEVIQKIAKMDNKVEQSIVGVDLFGTMWEDLGPAVISSFSKMDRGISKSSNSMQESIDGLYNTTKKKAEAQLKRLQSLGADFGKEMLPVLEKLIDKAEDFISCLDGMSDAEKENVVKIGLLVAGIGPLTKAVGTAGQVIGTTAKGIGTFSQAIGVMKNNTESGVASVDNLAKVLTGVTSPLGPTTMAITGLTTALWLAGQKSDENVIKAEKQINSLNKQKEATNELKNAQQEYLSTNLSEIENVEKLKKELLTLVDSNGKVKESYTGRVKFILGELNNALDTEYNLTDGVISKYGELTKSIDDVIAKKKANIILNSMENSYTNALRSRSDAIKNLAELEKTYSNDKQQIIEKENEKLDWQKKKQDIFTLSRINKLNEEIQTLKSNVNAYEDQKDKIIEYNTTIDDYETISATIKEGNVEKIEEINNRYTNSYRERKDNTMKSLSEQLEYESINLKLQKETYEKNQSDITNNQITESNNRLRSLAQELVNGTNTVGDLSPEQITAWTNLAKGSYDIYNEYITKVPHDTQKKIEETTGVIAKDTSVENATAELARKADTGFNNNINANKWGTDLTDELSKGMLAQKARKKVTDAASTVAGWVSSFLHFSLPEKGPLSDMDKSMPDMINLMANGINRNKSILIKSAERMAKELDNTLVNDIKVSQIRDFGKLQGGLNRQIANSSKTTNIDNRKVTFNIQGSNGKEIAHEIDRILGRQY